MMIIHRLQPTGPYKSVLATMSLGSPAAEPGVRLDGTAFGDGGCAVTFVFHAGSVHADDVCRRLSFADRNDESGEHYFIMDRSEESPEETVPDMDNVYIERDDQCWGGYGGIERVVLARDGLTVHLGERMATRMGGHAVIRVTFEVSDAVFRQLWHVIGLIMRGYESQLVQEAEPGATAERPRE
jgi:hypothetical protein